MFASVKHAGVGARRGRLSGVKMGKEVARGRRANVFFRRASLTAKEILVRSRVAIVAPPPPPPPPPPPLLSPPPRDDIVAYSLSASRSGGWGFARRCEKAQRKFLYVDGYSILTRSAVVRGARRAYSRGAAVATFHYVYLTTCTGTRPSILVFVDIYLYSYTVRM